MYKALMHSDRAFDFFQRFYGRLKKAAVAKSTNVKGHSEVEVTLTPLSKDLVQQLETLLTQSGLKGTFKKVAA